MDNKEETPETEEESWLGTVRALALPSTGYQATPVLAWANIAVFVVMALAGVSVLSPSAQTLFEWGGAIRAEVVQEGEYWRIITSCFVHAGIIHLLMNLYGLLMVGALLEPIIGWKRIMLSYFLTGTVGALASIAVNDNVVSVGASGAIFGLYGAFSALLFTDYFPKDARLQLAQSMGIFLAMNIFAGIKSEGEIDMAGHIGGFVSGLFLGGIYYFSVRDPDNEKRRNTTTILAVVVSMIIAFVLFNSASTSMDASKAELESWKKALDNVGLEENRAITNETSGDYIPAAQSYRQMAKLLNDMLLLDVPQQLRQRTELLIEYSNAQANLLEHKGNVRDSGDTTHAQLEEQLTERVGSIRSKIQDSSP
ncbi:MAG: rhomboid family intramembrane serine protease [Ignavibacteria bacterium]|nr:rhomboid family intramembrane serine protease [Ignavibacteria bacterium]